MRINGTLWSARDIAARIDHTVLAPDATRADMEKACSLAREYGFKAVFTNPYWTPRAFRRRSRSVRCPPRPRSPRSWTPWNGSAENPARWIW